MSDVCKYDEMYHDSTDWPVAKVLNVYIYIQISYAGYILSFDAEECLSLGRLTVQFNARQHYSPLTVLYIEEECTVSTLQWFVIPVNGMRWENRNKLEWGHCNCSYAEQKKPKNNRQCLAQ